MSQPPVIQANIFNSSFFTANSDPLTLDTADRRYLQLGGGSISGSLNVGGSLTVGGQVVVPPPDYVVGITPGQATNGKALVLDSSGLLSSLTLNSSGTGLSTPNLKFGSVNFDHAMYINIVQGSAGVSQAVVLNSSKDFNGIRNLTCSGTITGSTAMATQTLTCDTISKSGTQTMNATTLNLNPTTLQLRGTTINATAAQLNYNAGVVAGSAANSKTLVLGSAGDISGINSISAASVSTSGDITCGGAINGFLSFGNQANITTVGSLTELGINSTPTNEYFLISGSGLDYLDGSYTRMLTFSGSNTTPVQFQIEVHNGTNATAANATWIGNYTNNDLRFGINNSTAMILTTSGRLGIGTTSPSAPLHVPGSNNFVFGAGGTTVYRLRTDSGATESALGPITYSVAAIFGGYISCTAMAMTSDRRLKRNIQPCPIDRVKRLYDSCEVKLYEWNESENRQGQEIGLIAQDLVSAHLTDLISVFYRDDIQEEDDPSLEPAKTQLNVDYSRIAAYNMKMIQHLLDEINDLRAKIDALV
ncbi:unnamed protein product [Phytophthora lilii]|uniref:Unnamed protein product n=1 Tax=Phytophthora lilii TaxID=2077276 RepID=A0A9W6YKZ6_9STRA|nr:unnamed protein product [Phytophthora lilii]